MLHRSWWSQTSANNVCLMTTGGCVPSGAAPTPCCAALRSSGPFPLAASTPSVLTLARVLRWWAADAMTCGRCTCSAHARSSRPPPDAAPTCAPSLTWSLPSAWPPPCSCSLHRWVLSFPGLPCNPGLCAARTSVPAASRAAALHPCRRPPFASSVPSAVGTWQCTIKPASPVAWLPSASAPTCRRLAGPHFCSSSPAGAAAAAAAAARAGCPCCSRAGERRLLVAAWIAHGRLCIPHPALPPYACKPTCSSLPSRPQVDCRRHSRHSVRCACRQCQRAAARRAHGGLGDGLVGSGPVGVSTLPLPAAGGGVPLLLSRACGQNGLVGTGPADIELLLLCCLLCDPQNPLRTVHCDSWSGRRSCA